MSELDAAQSGRPGRAAFLRAAARDRAPTGPAPFGGRCACLRSGRRGRGRGYCTPCQLRRRAHRASAGRFLPGLR